MEYESRDYINSVRVRGTKKRPEFATKKSSQYNITWREKHPEKYKAAYKKVNNKQALNRAKKRLSFQTKYFKNHIPEIIRLYLKGRDISYIVTYTNLPSSIILKVLNDYNASIK